MIEYNNFLTLIHQISESFGIALDWFSDTFIQVGLGVVIWVGYVRHWVSTENYFSMSQCEEFLLISIETLDETKV